MKKQSLIDRRNNNDYKKLVDNLQKFQIKQEDKPSIEDTSALKKIFVQREKVAIEKVNYWGDMRKGLH